MTRRTFLLADDDPDDAGLFYDALSETDVSIGFVHAENGLKVFDLLKVASPDLPSLIFLDLNMPVMSGWQCLALLKENEQFNSIPVNMYTTSSHERDIATAEQMGAEGLITKPSSFRVLKSILHTVVHTPEHRLKQVIGDLAAMAKV